MSRIKITEIINENNSITEEQKIINSLTADLEFAYENIRNMTALFKAMHYGIAEGAVSNEEADECMTAFQILMDNILMDVESSVISGDYSEEVM